MSGRGGGADAAVRSRAFQFRDGPHVLPVRMFERSSDRVRVAERGDVCRVLSRAPDHDDEEVVGIPHHRDHGVQRRVAVDVRELSAETPRGPVTLTELEGRMLAAFLAAEGRVLTRSELLEQVWGLAADTETRTLDNFVVRLRKHFEADPANPRHFQTVRGRGYRFVREPEASDDKGAPQKASPGKPT